MIDLPPVELDELFKRRPAIYRDGSDLVRTKHASFMPGMFPAGAIAASAPAVQVRFVGNYTTAFVANTSASFNVLSGDVQYSGPDRQVLVLARHETVALAEANGVVIAGVNCRPHTVSPGFTELRSAYVSASGGFTVTINTQAANSETAQISVYECTGVADARKFWRASTSTATTLGNVVPVNGVAIAWGLNGTDTATHTWTGLTERTDVDGGTSRTLLADNLTPFVTRQDLSVTVAPSAGAVLWSLVIIHADPANNVITAYRAFNFVGALGSVSSWTINIPDLGSGTYRLILMLAQEINSAGTLTVDLEDQSFTQYDTELINTGPTPDILISTWYLDVVDGVTVVAGDLNVDFTGTSAGAVFPALYKVWNSTGLGARQEVQGNATGAAMSVGVVEGGCILAMNHRFTGTDVTAWTGVFEHTDASGNSLGERCHCAAEIGRTVQGVSSSGNYAAFALPVQ